MRTLQRLWMNRVPVMLEAVPIATWMPRHSSSPASNNNSNSSSANDRPTDASTSSTPSSLPSVIPNTPPPSSSSPSATLIVGKTKRQQPSPNSSGDPSSSASSRHNSEQNDPSFGGTTDGTVSSIRSGGAALKVKRRGPWGAMQLRDSWSEDAMSKRDNENMGRRIQAEYRFHPHEQQRQQLRYIGVLVVPALILGILCGYYYIAGKMLWHGDPQYVLNMVRMADCSPRSKFYPYRQEGQDELPPHIANYRFEKMKEQRELERLAAAEAEKLQRAIHMVRA